MTLYYTIKNTIIESTLLEKAFLVNAITIVHIKLVPFGLLVLFLAWLVELIRGNIFFDKIKLKSSLFVGIPFFLALVGVAYSTNISKGMEELSRVLPFLLFPFFSTFSTHNKSDNRLVKEKLLFLVFVVTLFLRLLFNYYESFADYLEVPRLYYFTYSWLVEDTNIVSIYLLFAIFGLYGLFSQKAFQGKTIYFWLIQSFFVITLVLLQSRIVIASYFIGMVFILIKNKLNWSTKYGILMVVLPVLLFTLPLAQSRFNSVQKQTIELVEKQQETKTIQPVDVKEIQRDEEGKLVAPPECKTSFQLRYNAILSSLKIIRRNPIIGVGTGDWRDELTEEYRVNNKVCNYVEQTAPHNQYLRTTLKYGLLGGLLLFFYFFVLLKNSIKSSSSIAFPFMVTLFLTSFGYDVLDVGGLAPMNAFFSTLIFVSFYRTRAKKNYLFV